MLKKETIDWIGEHLKNVKHLQPSVISRIPVEIIDDLNGELSRVPEYENIRNIIHSVIDGTCLERCRTCGKLMTYTKSVISRCEYCSRECIDNELRRGRMKEVFMKKYGVENISQSPVIKEKKRQFFCFVDNSTHRRFIIMEFSYPFDEYQPPSLPLKAS